MSQYLIPASTPPEIQQVLRDLHAKIDALGTTQNRDLSGTRLVNAGAAVDPSDYVTLQQVKSLIAAIPSASPDSSNFSLDTLTVTNLSVTNIARVAKAVVIGTDPGGTDPLRLTGNATITGTETLGTALVIGTDPGGGNPLRVGGGATINGATDIGGDIS